jgi:hypothetical protein
MKSLRVEVLSREYVPDDDARLDGVQVVMALVEGGGVPAPSQVWDEVPASRQPWTVHVVAPAGLTRTGVTMSRPASKGEPLLEPGQLVDLVQRPGARAGSDWRHPYAW